MDVQQDCPAAQCPSELPLSQGMILFMMEALERGSTLPRGSSCCIGPRLPDAAGAASTRVGAGVPCAH